MLLRRRKKKYANPPSSAMPPIAPTIIPAVAAVESPELACPPCPSPAVDVAGGVVVVAEAVSLAVPLLVLEVTVPVVVAVVLALVVLVALVLLDVLEARVVVDLVEEVVVVVAPFAASIKSSSVTLMGVFEVAHASLMVL